MTATAKAPKQKKKEQPQLRGLPAYLPPGRRCVVVSGARTPFTRAFNELIDYDSIALGVHAVRGLIERTGIDPHVIDEVVWGGVVLKGSAPNVAREIVLDANLPRDIPGMTVTRACLSGLQAITHAAAMIERGDADVVIAGGSDSTSGAEAPMPPKLIKAMAKLTMGGGKVNAKSLFKALKSIGSLRNLLPTIPKIAERSTGRTMGQHADDMARKNGVTREDQDAFAIRSHERAYKAQESGRFADEICPITLPNGKVIDRDTLVRETIDPAKIAKLRPVFHNKGTVTAASASPLTDGGACVLLMSAERAEQLGFPVDVVLTRWTYSALDPFDELLLGPALAIPKLLAKVKTKLSEIDVVELHEAFAAQMLRVLQALKSKPFASERLRELEGQWEPQAIGDDKLNPHGGSLAIGHPFAATGARLIMTAANELRLANKRRALVSLCAAGAMGGAALLERADV